MLVEIMKSMGLRGEATSMYLKREVERAFMSSESCEKPAPKLRATIAPKITCE
jgi:hypothetical protein